MTPEQKSSLLAATENLGFRTIRESAKWVEVIASACELKGFLLDVHLYKITQLIYNIDVSLQFSVLFSDMSNWVIKASNEGSMIRVSMTIPKKQDLPEKVLSKMENEALTILRKALLDIINYGEN